MTSLTASLPDLGATLTPMTTTGWRVVVASLTTMRLVIGVVLLGALPMLPAAALLPLAAAAVATDALDGWLARRYRVASDAGAAFDLAADAVFFIACIVAFWRLDVWPAWLVAALIASGAPEGAAQAIQIVRFGRMGSPRRWWNRLVGGYGYACVLAAFAGLAPVASGVGLIAIAWFANIADLAWALRRRRVRPLDVMP